jgi:hypothetical protein
MLILCLFMSLSQTDRQTDIQTYQKYSSEPHKIEKLKEWIN